jgi:hypothetical protein
MKIKCMKMIQKKSKLETENDNSDSERFCNGFIKT